MRIQVDLNPDEVKLVGAFRQPIQIAEIARRNPAELIAAGEAAGQTLLLVLAGIATRAGSNAAGRKFELSEDWTSLVIDTGEAAE